MTDDERCAGRFWWRKHIKMWHGQIVTGDTPLFGAYAVALGARDSSASFAARHAGIELELVYACMAFADYLDDHPELTPSELLGLPKEEPAKPKLMTKAEIAARIRQTLRSNFNPDHPAIKQLDRLAAAVELLPDAEPAKVSPFAKLVAAKLESARPDGTIVEGRNQLIVALTSEFHYAIEALVEGGDERQLVNLANLAVECQRAAEDLGLVPKQ